MDLRRNQWQAVDPAVRAPYERAARRVMEVHAGNLAFDRDAQATPAEVVDNTPARIAECARIIAEETGFGKASV